MKKKIDQVKVLLDALPYIKRYSDEIFVIKYGGSAQITPELKEKFARDIVLMYLVGIKPVIVHGGGRAIGDMLERLDIGSHFIDGLRVTDEKVMEVVEMVLSGSINKEITALLNEHGAPALGVSGKDASMLKAKPVDMDKYGYVGEITEVDPKVINNLIAGEMENLKKLARALEVIEQMELYTEQYDDFKSYCQDRWKTVGDLGYQGELTLNIITKDNK